MKDMIRSVVLFLALSLLLALPSLGQQAEPTWPQQFQVFQGEPTSFGFTVTQPGPIAVSVTAQGQPITVTLTGPLPQPVQQSGSGSFALTYNATTADVQRSALWVVELTAAGSAPAPMGRLPIPLAPTRAMAPVSVAAGSITVQHPPTNPQAVQAQFQQTVSAMQLQRQQASLQLATDTLATTKAAYAQQLTTQQAAQKQLLLSQVTVSKPITMATRQGPLIPTGIVSTGTTASADTGVAPAGSTGIQTVAKPFISLPLSVDHGQPGDPVLINGTGFTETTGEVHFLVNPGKDLVVTQIDFWHDGQIFAYVPDASGIQAFSGGLYVKSNGGQVSNLVPFQFNPLLDYQVLPDPSYSNNYPDSTINGTDFNHFGETGITHEGCIDPFGHKGDDTFFNTTTLKNGWVVDSVSLQTDSFCKPGGHGANIADSRIGTSSPYVKVHWWMDGFGEIDYWVTITIKGPKGVPYQ